MNEPDEDLSFLDDIPASADDYEVEVKKLKTVNRFKQFFLFQITAWWSLFTPKSTMFFLDAYKFKRSHDLKKEADKDL